MADPGFLSQLLLSPRETLEVELKNWLNPADKDDAAKIAKELIALANHGGGYLIFGFDDKSLAPDSPRPVNLENYSVDKINTITRKFAEPSFHCDVQHIAHPESNEIFPIVIVPGRHRVPIRCKKGHAQDFVTSDAYYFRLPGPESGIARSSRDWDDLLARCLFNRKDDLLNSIRSIINGPEELKQDANLQTNLLDWISESDFAADKRYDEDCGSDIYEYTNNGWWSIAYKIIDSQTAVPVQEIVKAMESSPGKRLYPPWDLARTDQAHRRFDTEKTVEWLLFEKYSHWKTAWTAYSRASEDLLFYLTSGYAEDVGESSVHPKPGTLFYASNAVEFFFRTTQHASHVCKTLNLTKPQIVITIQWFGTSTRHLGGFWNGPDATAIKEISLPARSSAREQIRSTVGPQSMELLESNFEEIILKPVQAIFTAFDLFLDEGQAKKYVSTTLANLREL